MTRLLLPLALASGCGSFGLERTVGDSTLLPELPGDSEPEPGDDTREEPGATAPELSSFNLAERQGTGEILVVFEAFDLDDDLAGGEALLTLAGESYSFALPADLDEWEAAGTSRCHVEAEGLQPGQTVNGVLALQDAAGHRSDTLSDSLVLAGSVYPTAERGDTEATAQDIGVLELPAVIEGDIYRASNDGSAYTADLDWVSFRVGSSVDATFSLSWDASGADYDLHLMRDGSTVAKSVQDGTAQPETFSRTLSAGATYTLVVAGWSGGAGDWVVTVE